MSALGRLTRWTLVVAVLALAAPAVASSPTPRPSGAAAAGSIGLSLLDDGSAGADPRARVYIVDRLGLGGVVHRQIEVANGTASTAHVALYSAAATIEHGTFVGAVGRTRNDVSTWTSVRPSAIDVPAGGRAVAQVTIRVADDATRGEQYGVVWAEVRSAPAAGGGVVEVSRVGIRIYLSVGPGAAPAADFTIGSVRGARSATGEQLVTASVRNSGGRALDMVGTLQLVSGPGRVRAGPFPVALGTTVGVGDTQPVTVALSQQLPAGPWTAQLVLRSGLLERRAQAMITFPDRAQPPPGRSVSGRGGWVGAVLSGAAGLLGLGAVLALLRRRRRRGPPGTRRDDAREALHPV